jgi:hypothetical protein
MLATTIINSFQAALGATKPLLHIQHQAGRIVFQVTPVDIMNILDLILYTIR